MKKIRFVENDGGREAAGFKGETGDCVTRAIAIATGIPYRTVYDLVNDTAIKDRRLRGPNSARLGVHKKTTRNIMALLGWKWTPTMLVGQGCKVHLRASELPSGRIIVKLSGHIAAVIDGVLHDSFDCSRDGTRCVYGYWSEPNPDEQYGD